MLRLAFVCASLAVLLGGLLYASRMRRLAFVHGGLGALGLGLAIRGYDGRLSVAALDSLVFTGAALAGGVLMLGFSRAGRARPALLVLLHAMGGFIGYLLLAGAVFRR